MTTGNSLLGPPMAAVVISEVIAPVARVQMPDPRRGLLSVMIAVAKWEEPVGQEQFVAVEPLATRKKEKESLSIGQDPPVPRQLSYQ